MFVYESIRLTIPKLFKLYCYVKARKQKIKQTLHLNASLTASESGANIFLLCSTTVSTSLIQI